MTHALIMMMARRVMFVIGAVVLALLIIGVCRMLRDMDE
jgi:hypothetical protein